MAAPVIHVAVAVIRQGDNVLLSQRAEHVDQGGLWEFPGGKVEPGETIESALERELGEELGITPTRYRPLIQIPHHYPQYRVLLDVWRVSAFTGEPHGREGQPVRWVPIEQLGDYDFPDANRSIVTACQLPERYLVTPDPREQETFLEQLHCALEQGIRLVQLRAHNLYEAEYIELAQRVLPMAAEYGARVLLNAHWSLLQQLPQAHGIHLPGHRLAQLNTRPIATDKLLSVACHSRKELLQAVALGADLALLSPVKATASHPEAKPLGWEKVSDYLQEIPLPVYVLGGMGEEDLQQAWACGAQGIAAIRSLWGER